MKLRFFIAFLLLSLTSQAQFVIRGKVVSGDNDEPLPFANVFLANTTKGATTNEKGAFVLPNLSPGRFDVVVSYVGYETLVFPIRTDSARISSYLIKLKPIANQLAEVRVKARRGEDWQQNLDFFIKNFIGQSENSRQCKLLNPDVLWFDDDRPNTILTAGAREPLLIENNGLGYRVKYQLESFVYDYGQRLISYVGYPVLEVLKPKSPRQAKRWEANRRTAYFGSTTHFMRALHNRKLQEEGFEVRRIIERDDSVRIGANKQLKKIRMLLTDLLPYSDFTASDTVNSSLTKMAFQDLLQVTYLQEKEEINYLKIQSPFGRLPRGPGPQVSIMRLVKPYILVEPNGHYYEPLGLFFEGYLTWEKIAELLPLEYEP